MHLHHKRKRDDVCLLGCVPAGYAFSEQLVQVFSRTLAKQLLAKSTYKCMYSDGDIMCHGSKKKYMAHRHTPITLLITL